MEINWLQDVIKALLVAPAGDYSNILKNKLSPLKKTYDQFIKALALELEKPVPQLKLTSEEILKVLQLLPATSALRDPAILKHLPEKLQKQLAAVKASSIMAAMNKELKEKLLESLADVFHQAWMKWAGAVKPEVSPERSARWDEYMVPYDQLEENVKDLDREWAVEALDAIESDLDQLGGPVKEMVTRVQVDSAKYPQLSRMLAASEEAAPSVGAEKSNVQKARQLGQAAFKRGIKSAPALDQEFMKMFAGKPVGSPDSIPMMKAWQAGWNEENLKGAV